jgi:intracellular septation protein
VPRVSPNRKLYGKLFRRGAVYVGFVSQFREGLESGNPWAGPLDRGPTNPDNAAIAAARPFMKFVFDLFPVVLFFAAFKLQGIYVATAVAIAATFLQIGWVWFRHRKVDTMLWVSLAVIVVFGGATLLLHDETFIKWKPTVLYWLFGSVLLGAQMLFGKNLIRALMGKEIRLPDDIWNKLNVSWVIFFATMGILNLLVAYNFDTDTWVNFKLFGGLGLTLAFVVLQGLALARFMEPERNK